MKYLIIIGLVLFPSVACAEHVIGRDLTWQISVMPILTSDNSSLTNPCAYAFNYFFSLQIYFGLLAFWLRNIFRVFRM